MSQYDIIKGDSDQTINKFLKLKSLIKAEMARRGDTITKQNSGSSAATNKNKMNRNNYTQDFTKTTNVNNTIFWEHINETYNLLRQITTSPNYLNSKIIDNYSIINDIDQAITLMNNISNYNKSAQPASDATGDAKYMGCAGQCRGLCSKSCYNTCAGSCSGSGKTTTSTGPKKTESAGKACSSCGTDCSGNCSNVGQGSVGYHASVLGCSGNCTGVCVSVCAGSCQGNCNTSCLNNCKGGCKNGCEGTCSGCGATCSSSCSACTNQCGSCDSGCSSNCAGCCKNGCALTGTGGTLPPEDYST